MFFNIPSFGLGFIAGFGAGFVSREIASAAKEGLKPLTKEVMRTGMQVVEKGKEAAAHVGEAIEDLLAEVRQEAKAGNEKVATKQPKAAKTKKKAPVAKKA